MSENPEARDKALRLLAKVLPHMFARWRWPADFETLAGLPDGKIVIDVLEGRAVHESEGSIELAVAGELKAGLESQLAKHGISRDTLAEVSVTVLSDTSRVRTDRERIVHFDFRISSRLRTETESHEGFQEEEHVWHSREPD